MRNSPSFFSQALLLACAGFFLGCSGGGGGTSTPQPSATTTSLVLSSSSINTGASVTLTATVKSSGASVTAGSVTFLDGSATLGTGTLNSSGQASYSTSVLAAGSHSLTASYAGTTNYLASTSSASTLKVTAPTLQSALTLTASAATSTQGLPVELVASAVAASAPGPAIPTGTVTFTNGATTLGTASLDSTGVANFTSTLLPSGSNSITATYSGDTNYSSANATAASVNIKASAASTYTNPLTLNVTNSQTAISCADPAIYKYQKSGVDTWYLYCTSDALYAGDPNPHYLNIFQSSDLVSYTYVGNAFSGLPSWGNASGSALWAPAIRYINGQYLLYYANPVTNSTGGAAVGVGTSSSPAGPFVDSGTPVVEPEVATNCCNGAYRSTIDPDEIQDASGQRWLLFGSFTGGIFVRKLSADGLTSDPASEVQIAMDNRYEGGNWWYQNGYYYLFASSTNCCNGPLSGYGVFVGRSTTPTGPYLDAQGISMTATNVGGTPVIRMNGNSVIGPGGNVIFADESGQTYILYHGILNESPYYQNNVGYTARPGFIDAIDWVNGWPVARGGFGPSDIAAPQPLPASQPAGSNSYVTTLATQDAPRTDIASLSDSFTSTTLSSQWSFLHGTPSYTLPGSGYQVQTVGYDTTNAMANVPLLSESAPAGDYMVETKLSINLPVTGENADYAQAGLLIYGDDNNYIRLDMFSNSDTRQIEFIKQYMPPASGYPTWGSTNLGPPIITTTVNAWLRIVRRNVNGDEHYTAYSSNDDLTWTQSGTWVHSLGSSEKICIYAGNRSGYIANFDYVHVTTLQ
jgi:arabinan endo-1,5-alpha-L-arabinosidase